MARAKKTSTADQELAAQQLAQTAQAQPKPPTKTQRLIETLETEDGATIPDLMEVTGWQAHSVRGAIAGHLKRKLGLVVTSSKVGTERRYKIGGDAA